MCSYAEVLAVCVVHAIIPDVGGKQDETAIDKRPVLGAVDVQRFGLTGDTQCDTAHHGGDGKAVYAYAQEDADWWAADLERELPPGRFGENLRTRGLDITNALLGEQWRTVQDFQAMLADPVAGEHMAAAGALASAQPHLYTVVSVHHA